VLLAKKGTFKENVYVKNFHPIFVASKKNEAAQKGNKSKA
jgi:hypothetical protein